MHTESLPQEVSANAANCIEVIKTFDGILPPELDNLVPLHDVRRWYCEAFKYSEDTFKRTHLKEIDQNYFRSYFGVRPRRDGETGEVRHRPSTDLFYQSRVVWWLIERKKRPAVSRYQTSPTARPDPDDYR